ncbi:kinase-like protein, partial [Ceratobasidium sp. AG-I]
MYDLGLTLFRLGRWEEAESIQERVCDHRKQALGESHPETLSAMHSLASTYSEQGRWGEAQDLHEHVLKARRKVLGEQHADTLSSMHSLATKHQEAGQSTNDSEALNLEVLEKRKGALGLEHPDTLSSMSTLALVYHRQGQWQKATDLAANTLEKQVKVLGQDHTETLSTMYNLASWYSKHGRMSEAISLRKEILKSRRAIYGDESREALASMGALVSEYWKQGLWAQAEILHLELLEAIKRAFGEEDPVCTTTSLDLATHYLSQCRWREASLVFKEVLAVKKQDQEIEADDPEVQDIQQQLDLALFALSVDVFIISPAVPIESVVAHFTGRAGLKDYSSLLQEALDPPTEPFAWGGFSKIYRIKVQDGRELAVKCLKSAHGEYKQVKQTIRELSTWSQLRHKSIAELLGLALFKEQLAMVSAWNKYGNVMNYIEQQPNMDRYGLCMQVVNAVVYLHKSEVVAPEIVFGNETSLNSGQASGSMSVTLTAMKEHKNSSDSQPKLCKETDIYALGMTMLEILTGKRPFKELEKDTAVILALGKGKRPHRPKRILDQSPRGVPFWDILQKCWAQTPGNRPTASEV